MKNKIVVLFLILVFLNGCSEEPLKEPITKNTDIPEITATPEIDELYSFRKYPSNSLTFTCREWVDSDFDDRFNFKSSESGEDSTIMYLELYAKVNDRKIKMFSNLGTINSRWMQGSYEYLGNNSYSYEMEILRYGEQDNPEGGSSTIVVEENTKITGFLYHEEEKIYYLKDSDDFKNYMDYPYCKIED